MPVSLKKKTSEQRAVDMPFRKRPGRPPAGFEGESVRDYPRIMLRLPPETAAKLRAWAEVSGVPQWKLINQALQDALYLLGRDDAEDVKRLAKRYVGRYRR